MGWSKPSASRRRAMSCWLASAGSIRSTGSPLSRTTQNTTRMIPTRTSAVCAIRRPMYPHGSMAPGLLRLELHGAQPLVGEHRIPRQALREPDGGLLLVEEDERRVVVEELERSPPELLAPLRIHRRLVGEDRVVGLRALVVVTARLRVQQNLEDAPRDDVAAPRVEIHLELLGLV